MDGYKLDKDPVDQTTTLAEKLIPAHAQLAPGYQHETTRTMFINSKLTAFLHIHSSAA